MREITLDRLAALIRVRERFIISTHERPEGDAIGSQLGLAAVLAGMGKSVSLVNRDPVPETLRFLPGWDTIEVSERLSASPDLWLIVDCSGPERTGLAWEGDLTGRIAVIDHHPGNSVGGEGLIWLEPSAPAAGLMVSRLARALGAVLSPEAATALFVAIATDTGSFRYSNTTPEGLREAADLVTAGADPWGVAQSLYEDERPERLRLLGTVLGTLAVSAGGAVAWVEVRKAFVEAAGSDDIEGFVNTPRSVRGVEVGILFEEVEPDLQRVSLRSRGRVNVAAVAESLGGGGHAAAAGATVRGTLESVREVVLKKVEEAVRKRLVGS